MGITSVQGLDSEEQRAAKSARQAVAVPTRDLTTELFFAAALRAGADGAFTRLLPLSDLREPLAPHDRFAQRILLALQGLGYIEPELSSSWVDDWLHSRDWLFHGFESVSWRILRFERPTKEALRTWLEGDEVTPSALETCAEVWEDLALAEAAAYARWTLAQTGFDPNWAYNATNALAAGLKAFSVDQVMYLVHIALRSLALAHQRGSTRVAKAAHIFASSLSSYVQRAAAERWAIRGMPRPLDMPRSAIAILFAEVITDLGDRYYTERPCLESLMQTGRGHEVSR